MGIPIDALDMDATVARVADLVVLGRPAQHVVMNAAKYVMTWKDPGLERIVSSCELINADGQAVVWASRLLGRPLPARVAGIDLFDRLVAESATRGWRCYFLGAQPHVVAAVVEKMRAAHPALEIAGHRDGYWDDDAVVIEGVRASRPDLLFLAIPSPLKEFWLREHLHSLGVPFVMGVGGTFDVVAGVTRRAPRLLQRLGLEWFYRLVQEPRRMFKRYVVGNSVFVYGVVRALIRRDAQSNPLEGR